MSPHDTHAALPALLRAAAHAYPNEPAVIDDARRIRFAEFDRASDQIACALAARGIVAGDRVALYCINSAEFALAYTGILKAGATVVPINLLLVPAEVAYIVNDAGARGVLYAPLFQTVIDSVGVQTPALEFSIALPSFGTLTWDDTWASAAPLPQPQFDTAEAVAVILYTSGTTGRPKGAMLTHRNLAANTASVRQALDWQAGSDVVLLVLPMFHAFAATVGMLTPLLCGCAFVPVARFEPEVVARSIAAHKATVFLGVPSMYNLLLRLKDELVPCLRSLRVCVSGGAALPVEVLQRFVARFGVPLLEGDGPTECSPVTCVNPVAGPIKPGTVGLSVPEVEMRIVDDAGAELPRGVVGEIAVRGPNVMKGYWRQPEATAEVLRDGWLLTGDLGTEDEDGYFSIVDRKKDLVIVNGMNVYPRVVEEVLYQLDGIREAAVIGEAHALHGEVPVAYVSLLPDSALDSSAIREWCRTHLGRHQVPRRVEVLADLPKNAAGKILKRQLRKHGEVERGVVGLE